MSWDSAAYDTAFADLAEVVREESWVLTIGQHGGVVEFVVDAVLTPRHPEYATPRRGDMHCYRRGTLTVAGAEPPSLRLSGAPPATDATGEQDLDHIDSFQAVDIDGRDTWQMQGTWGRLKVTEPSVSLRLS